MFLPQDNSLSLFILMFVCLCQSYITFNSNSIVSEWQVGVVYLHAIIKGKVSHNPVLLPLSQLYTPTPLFQDSGYSWEWPAVLARPINESSWPLPSPSKHVTSCHVASHMLLLREDRTGPWCLCQPWLCPDSTLGSSTLAKPHHRLSAS